MTKKLANYNEFDELYEADKETAIQIIKEVIGIGSIERDFIQSKYFEEVVKDYEVLKKICEILPCHVTQFKLPYVYSIDRDLALSIIERSSAVSTRLHLPFLWEKEEALARQQISTQGYWAVAHFEFIYSKDKKLATNLALQNPMQLNCHDFLYENDRWLLFTIYYIRKQYHPLFLQATL